MNQLTYLPFRGTVDLPTVLCVPLSYDTSPRMVAMFLEEFMGDLQTLERRAQYPAPFSTEEQDTFSAGWHPESPWAQEVADFMTGVQSLALATCPTWQACLVLAEAILERIQMIQALLASRTEELRSENLPAPYRPPSRHACVRPMRHHRRRHSRRRAFLRVMP